MRGGAQGRIIQGNRAKSPIPWQVAIQDSEGDLICGGTILDKMTVLTAAHCLANTTDYTTDYTDFNIMAGRVSRELNKYRTNIAKVIIHPQWSWDTLANDVAIIKLTKPFTFGKNIKPMCLPSKDFKPREGEMCITSGWGTIFCEI